MKGKILLGALTLLAVGLLVSTTRQEPDDSGAADELTEPASPPPTSPAADATHSPAPDEDVPVAADAPTGDAPPEAFVEQPEAARPDAVRALHGELRAWAEEQGLDEVGVTLGEPDCSAVPCVTPMTMEIDAEGAFEGRKALLAEARRRSGLDGLRVHVSDRRGGREHAVLYMNEAQPGTDAFEAIETSVKLRAPGPGVQEEELGADGERLGEPPAE